jgi:hypothetical protein
MTLFDEKNCDSCDRMPMNKKCFMDCSRQIDSDSDIDLFETKAPTQPDLISREKVIDTINNWWNGNKACFSKDLINDINQIKREGNNER